MSHTKAEWKAETYNVKIGESLHYLVRNDGEHTAGELRANAKLIAAAPEMLNFINACADCKSNELEDFFFNNYHKVIEKATS